MAIPVPETAAAAPRAAVPSSPPPSPHAPPVVTRMDYRVARPRNSGGRFVRLTPAQRNALLAASGPRVCAACGTASTTQWRFWGGDLPGGGAGAADRWRGTKISRRGSGSAKDDRSLLCNACGISIKRRTRRLRAAVAAAATAAPPAAAPTVGGGCASVSGPGQGPSVGSPPADGTTHGEPPPPRGWPNADAMSGVTTSSRRSAAAAGSRVGVTSPSHSGRGWGTAWAATSPEPPKAAVTSPRTGGGGGGGGSGGGVGSPITISNLLADDTTCYYTELGSAVAMPPLTLGGRPWHPPALPSTPASGAPPPPRPVPAAAATTTATAATAATAAAAAVTTAATVAALPAAPLPPLPPLRGCGTDLPPLGRPPHRRPSAGRGRGRDAWSPPWGGVRPAWRVPYDE